MDREAVYVPPALGTTLENSFSLDVSTFVTPGFVEHHSVVSMQIDLYDTASEDLVWSLNAQTINPDNATDVMNGLSDAVVSDMRSKGLI